MARARRNLFVLTSRLLLSWAAVVLLSETTSGEQVRKCYWCGPLAEQVHRSRRAPSCKTIGNQSDDYITECEPGFPYCAVVATSPPQIESRFCVKLYQDECYSLYCNTTKTWKMTCPCQGDMCNGRNTDREKEAFTVLAKLVAKTHNIRIKKRSVDSDEIDNNNQLNQLNEDVSNSHHIVQNHKESIQTSPESQMEEPKDNNMAHNILSEESKPFENDNMKTEVESDMIGRTATTSTTTITNIATTTVITNIVKTTVHDNKDMVESNQNVPAPGALQQNADKTLEHVITTESTTTAMETTSIPNMKIAPSNATKNNTASFAQFNVMCLLVGSAVNLL